MTDTKEAELDVRCSDSLEKKDDIAPEDIRDIGANLYAEVERLSPEEIEEEGIRVRKMLDRRILPILYLTFVMQFLDKLSLNYASAYTLIPDLGLEGQRYSWVAAIFYFGYSRPFLIQRSRLR